MQWFEFIGPVAAVSVNTAVTNRYPVANNATYVKANSLGSGYYPYLATDPARSLTGNWSSNCWVNSNKTQQRFHLDLGSAYVITKIYYEPGHHIGTDRTLTNPRNFTLWGTSSATAFAQYTVYSGDTDWVQVTTGEMTFHDPATDTPDPNYITFYQNTTAYRYWGFKFADTWGDPDYMAMRRVVLQGPYITTTAYTNRLPTAQNATYVKATSIGTNYWPYLATDPTKSLTGGWASNCWVTSALTNQRFHIDLGSAYTCTRLYYEPGHHIGTDRTLTGMKNVVIWATSSATAFAQYLVYSGNTDWVQMTATTLEKHDPATDTPDPNYVYFANSTAYQYWGLTAADNWGDLNYMAMRRIIFQDSGTTNL